VKRAYCDSDMGSDVDEDDSDGDRRRQKLKLISDTDGEEHNDRSKRHSTLIVVDINRT